MLINEIFSSIEGEGIRSGYLATFIRTQGCNLRCSYCDTEYAQDFIDGDKKSQYIDMSVSAIVKRCFELKNQRITFTGGEPLLQSDAVELLEILTQNDFIVNIETNGSIDLSILFAENNIKLDNVIITMDWKSLSSFMNKEMRPTNLPYLRSQDVLKFVVGSHIDLLEMCRVLKLVNQLKCQASIFVSPIYGQIQGDEIVEFLKTENLQNVRLQLQLHKYIWPVDKRGV